MSITAEENSKCRPTYAASEAAVRAGLSRQGLLTWERRYGFPQPARDSRGYRRYTEDDLIAIARVRSAVGRGLPVETAVRQLSLASKVEDEVDDEGVPSDLLRNTLDAMPVQVAILRPPNHQFVYVNRALVRAVPTARVGTTVGAVLNGLGSTLALDRVTRTGEPWHEPAEPLVVNGELRYFAATYIRLAATPGQPYHILGIGFDVTEAERARRRVTRSENALLQAQSGQAQMTLLKSIHAVARASTGGFDRTVRAALERLVAATDADGASFAVVDGGWMEPKITHYNTHGLRWARFPVKSSELLAEAVHNDAVTWLQASRVQSRSEQALLRRLVARTLCCIPVLVDGCLPAVILLRWSVNEHVPTMAEFTFIDSLRHMVRLAARGEPSSASRQPEIIRSVDCAADDCTPRVD